MNTTVYTPRHKLTRAQKAQLKALDALSDSDINYEEIPEKLDWSNAKRGLLYRPMKKQLTLRLDADLIAWFKNHAPKGEGYQTGINSALRKFVAQQSGSS